jgi:CubicO group peptidase (beta-lactamase class C family)
MKRLIALGLMALFFGSFSAQAQDDKRMDALMGAAYPAGEPGAAVLVAKAGQPLYRKGFGMGNLEHGLPIAPDMVFEIGSITKQFTAVGILMLAEEGKLALSDTLGKFFPGFPGGGSITLHQMLTHTSGLNNYTDMPEWVSMWRQDIAPRDFAEKFKEHPMVGAPGEKFAYSNSAYFMLGVVIEQASGMPYEQFLDARIFKPLGMENSYYGSWQQVIRNRAAGYQPASSGEGFANATYLSFSQPYAAGSILSTVDDLMKWNEALHAGKVLKPESLALAFQNHTTSDGKPIGYGYGWAVTQVAGLNSVEHGGGIFGFVTYALYVPSEKLFVAVLTNRDDKNPEEAAVRLAAMALGKPYPDASEAAVSLSEAQLKPHVGAYEFEDGAVRFISYEDGSLYSQREGGQRFKIVPVSETLFAFENSLNAVEFPEAGVAVFHTRAAEAKGKKVDRAMPSERKAIELPEEVLAQYVGVYEMMPGFDFTFTLEGTQLMAQATGQSMAPVFPETETSFFFKVVDAQVEFVKDESGKVVSLLLSQGGRKMPAKRKN